MKKKFKLFATIGSLCLAVAMMTVGVLAATAQSVAISNTIKFTATAHVKAAVTLNTPVLTNCIVVAEGKGAEYGGETYEFDGADSQANQSWDLGTVSLTPASVTANEGKMTYAYTVKIENKATANEDKTTLEATITVPADVTYTAAGGYGIAVTGLTGTGTERVITIAQDAAAVEYTVTITVNCNKSLAAAGVNIGSNVALKMIEA